MSTFEVVFKDNDKSPLILTCVDIALDGNIISFGNIAHNLAGEPYHKSRVWVNFDSVSTIEKLD